MGPFYVVLLFVRAIFRDQAELAAENLALRQQLAALQHRSKRPRLKKRDRIFWAILSRIWRNWRSALLIVQPDTVVRWHPHWVQAVLALEVPNGQARSSKDRGRDSRVDSPHVTRESELGRPAHSV